jgi:hypothetical protein
LLDASDVLREQLDVVTGSLVQDQLLSPCILNLQPQSIADGVQLAARREIRQKRLNPIRL